MKNKYIFFGEENSINSELIIKSFHKVKTKVRYIVIGNKEIINNQIQKLKSNIQINEILDPFNFQNLDINKLNVFNINYFDKKIINLLFQIKICNQLCNYTGYDLITLPINKHIFKKKIKFNGMTEYLGEINKKKTIMLMYGENFSIMPITTHINLNSVGVDFDKKLKNFNFTLKKIDKKTNFLKKYKNLIFLCFNPHCGENGTIGKEDLIIKKALSSIKSLKNYLIPADSAFKNIQKKSIYVSFYHDQALIPFKILNKKSFNQTLGLNYRRLSPSHGTAEDIKFQNLADNTSYIQCIIN